MPDRLQLTGIHGTQVKHEKPLYENTKYPDLMIWFFIITRIHMAKQGGDIRAILTVRALFVWHLPQASQDTVLTVSSLAIVQYFFSLLAAGHDNLQSFCGGNHF
jgi:hypothetical protein